MINSRKYNLFCRIAVVLGLNLLAAACICPSTSKAQLTVAAVDSSATSRPRPRLVTLDRARQALQLAKLAAQNKMTALSLRAVRESLSSGPPVQPIVINRNRISSGSAQSAQATQYITEVESAVRELNALWKKHDFPPADVYKTLTQIVVPDSRPDETFLYAKLLSTNFNSAELKQPRSVGAILADWAVQAKQTDDLKQRLVKRIAKPKAQVASLTLLTQLEMAAGNTAQVNAGLTKLTELTKQNSLKHSAEIACHAALPAIQNGETSRAAVDLIEQLLANLPASTSSDNYQAEPNSSLQLLVARARFKSGDAKQGMQHIEDFLSGNQTNNNRHSGDYGTYMRQHQLATAADELMAAKQIDMAFQLIGEAADITTRYSYDPLGGGRSNRLINHLNSLDAASRYKYLYNWCMPKKTRQNLRHIASASYAAIPPAVFRKLQGPNPHVNTGERIVSSAKSLISSAQECDKLDDLIAELQTHVAKKVENTPQVLAMALIATGNFDQAQPLVTKIKDDIKEARKSNDRKRDSWLDYQVGSAWAEAIPKNKNQKIKNRKMVLDAVLAYTRKVQKTGIQTEIYRSLAVAAQRDRGITNDLFTVAKPAMWTPGTIGAYDRPATWLAHEGHISHIHALGNDALYLKFPVTGEFEFSVDCVDDGWAESDIAYGSISVVDHGYNSRTYVQSPRGSSRLQKTEPTHARRSNFVRKSVRVTKDSVTHLINGHPVYKDENPAGFTASPWIELVATSERKTIYRNPRFSGTPTIPKQLRLSDDPGLRGWLSGSSREQVDPLPAVPEDSKNWTQYTRTTEPVWTWQDGQIIGKAVKNPTPGTTTVDPKWLQYPRPMQNGDNIAWEFHFKPGEQIVHPSLGRMAYELPKDADNTDNNKVQLRWYLFPEHGPENRIALEQEQRADVALTEGWNQGQMAIEGNTALLTINGQLVYEHPLEANEERKFGFYFNQASETARIKNVVLKGDWPAQVTADHLAALTSRVKEELNEYERKALGSAIGEHFIARHPIDVVRYAVAINDPEQRFLYLYNWVMPGIDHWQIRTGGDLTPANPAPPVRDSFIKSTSITGPGGQIVAPLLMLVDLAKELGRTDEFIKRLKQATSSHPRHGHAALALAYLSIGKTTDALTSMNEVGRRTLKTTEFSPNRRWPEVLLASKLMENPDADPALVDSSFRMLHAIIHKQIQSGKEGDYAWAQHVRALHAGLGDRMLSQTVPSQTNSDQATADIQHWSTVTHPRAETNGVGMPAAKFRLTAAGEAVHGPGFDEDYLYFDVPLIGDFQVDCELTSFDYREMCIGYAGVLLQPEPSRETVKVVNINRTELVAAIKTNLDVGTWYRYRIVVKDNTMTCFIDDEEVYETEILEDRDPWLYVRAYRWTSGGIRNFKITGTPTVPKEYSMMGGEQLVGWSSRYFEDTIGPNTGRRSD